MTYKENLEYVLSVGTHSQSFFSNPSEYGGYHLQQNPIEFAKFLTYVQERGAKIKNYLEIGSASGGFIRCIHERIGFDFGVMIDDGNYQALMQEENIKDFKNKISRHIMDSHCPMAKEILRNRQTKYDLIWIDGDHSYEGVMQDIELVLPYADFNTLICFHDIDCPHVPGVKKAYQEILATNKLVEVAKFIEYPNDALSFGVGLTKKI